MRILFLDHHFEPDLKAMARANPGHELKVLPKAALQEWASKNLPPAFQERPERPESLSPELRETWDRYNRELFEAIRAEFPFDLFVTPSYLFYWIRRFIGLCREEGVPTIVLQKEVTYADYMMQGEIPEGIRASFPFHADLMIVNVDRAKRFWIAAGTPEERILVAGQPRFDGYFHASLRRPLESFGVRRRPGRKRLLFLGYFNHVCSTAQERSRGEMSASRMREETAAALLRFLQRRPEVDLCVKFHPQQAQFGDHTELERSFGAVPGLSVQLVRGTEGACELLLACDAVVGFNSTALAEAMAIGKPAIFTFWREMWERFEPRTLPYHRSGGCEVARSADELDALLEQALFRPDSLPDRRESRARYVLSQLGPFDGRCAERAWGAIESFLGVTP